MIRLSSSIRRLRFLLLILLVDLRNVNTHQTSSTQQTPGHQLSTRVVQTKYGALRGAILHFQNPHQSTTNLHSTNSKAANDKSTSSANSQNNKQVNANFLQPVEFFLGVPYATAPQGSLRFMPPVTTTHWRGVRLAHKHGSVCLQKLPSLSLPYSTSGPRSQNNNTDDNQLPEARVATLKRLIPYIRNQSEDCLNLNIYLPYRAENLKIANAFEYIFENITKDYELIVGFPGILCAFKRVLRERDQYLKKLGRAQYDPLKPMYVPLSAFLMDENDFLREFCKTDQDDFFRFLKTV